MTFDEPTYRQRVTEWRTGYCDSFAWHQSIYSRIWATNPPAQAYFCADGFPYFDGARVCELGGWDGALARSIKGYARWVNFEVCREAAELATCETVTDSWMWDNDLGTFDVFVASHSIEHMTVAHLDLLLKSLHATKALVQVPYDMGPSGAATHILGLSVGELRRKFACYGWEPERENARNEDVVWWFTRRWW